MGGGRERKQDTRIIAYIVIALGMIVVWGFFFVLERNSHRRATLINKANVQISVLGIKLIEIFISFFSRDRINLFEVDAALEMLCWHILHEI